MCLTAQEKIRIRIKNKTAGHAGIACFSFALKGNRAGSPHFKIVRFKWWEHVTTVFGHTSIKIISLANVCYIIMADFGIKINKICLSLYCMQKEKNIDGKRIQK